MTNGAEGWTVLAAGRTLWPRNLQTQAESLTPVYSLSLPLSLSPSLSLSLSLSVTHTHTCSLTFALSRLLWPRNAEPLYRRSH